MREHSDPLRKQSRRQDPKFQQFIFNMLMLGFKENKTKERWLYKDKYLLCYYYFHGNLFRLQSRVRPMTTKDSTIYFVEERDHTHLPYERCIDEFRKARSKNEQKDL